MYYYVNKMKKIIPVIPVSVEFGKGVTTPASPGSGFSRFIIGRIISEIGVLEDFQAYYKEQTGRISVSFIRHSTSTKSC